MFWRIRGPESAIISPEQPKSMMAAESASGCEGSEIPTGNPLILTGFRINPLEKHCMCFLESILQDSQRGIVVSITTWIKLKGIAAMNPGVKEPRLSLSNCGFLFRLLFLNVILCLQCLGRVGARRIACFSPKLFLGMFIVKRNLKNSCNFVWESGKQRIRLL